MLLWAERYHGGRDPISCSNAEADVVLRLAANQDGLHDRRPATGVSPETSWVSRYRAIKSGTEGFFVFIMCTSDINSWQVLSDYGPTSMGDSYSLLIGEVEPHLDT